MPRELDSVSNRVPLVHRFRLSFRRLPPPGSTHPSRFSARYTPVSEGTGSTPRLKSSLTSNRTQGPINRFHWIPKCARQASRLTTMGSFSRFSHIFFTSTIRTSEVRGTRSQRALLGSSTALQERLHARFFWMKTVIKSTPGTRDLLRVKTTEEH